MKITLSISDDFAPLVSGEKAAQAALEAIKLDPAFWVNAADELRIEGEFGRFTESRE
jgi:hypothetical protein